MSRNDSPVSPGCVVWAYCRDSGGEDQDITSQKAAVLEYIEHHGLVLDRLFVDEATSGTSVAGREQFQQMIYLSKKEPKEAEAILVWDFSRFARNVDEALYYTATLRHRGFEVVSITEPLPQMGRYARLVEVVEHIKNEEYSIQLGLAIKRGLHSLAERGFAPGGFPPRGYKAEKVESGTKRNEEPRYGLKWIPDEEWAPKVRRAWQMKAQGASYREIVKETDIYKSICCLSDFFRNLAYLGVIKCGDLRIEGAHEPLVDKETWDKVQAQLYSRPGKGEGWPDTSVHPRRKGSTHLLSGLAHCLYCGASMIGETDKRKDWRFYMCGRKRREGRDSCEGSKMSARMVEEEVMRKVLTRVLTLDYVRDLVAEVNQRLADDLSGLDTEIARTEKEIAGKEQAIGALLDLAETEGSNAAAERLRIREQERESLLRHLDALRWRREHERIEVGDDLLLSILEEMAQGVREGDVAGRRRVLRHFVTNVEVGRKRGRLWYTFPLSQVSGLYLVPLEGFEPPTHCLEGSCSNPLSYRGQPQTYSILKVRPCQGGLMVSQRDGLKKSKSLS